ncbi:GumC family protein [Terriglobus aquaticus]|uniref:GumC family protein n=1 Tax=Terriglobus aquaticus TaxID=940139 RepID=A0ABW9KGC0_9BACT|nr:GNVR domain-containing protein [Terriglobus aquaticus]
MLGHRSLVMADYISILKRRGWIVLIPLVILPIIAVAFSYTIPPQYLSQTSVLVEGQRVAEGIVKPVISTDLDSRLGSMKERILSRSSLQPIVDRYNLYADKKASMDDRIDMARKNIDVKTIASETGRGLPGFFISFKAGDAHTAQQVCTEITSLFINESLKSSSEAAGGTVDFLRSQLEDAKRKMDEQDAKLAQFQVQYLGRLPGEEGTNSNMLASLNGQLESITQALGSLQREKALTETMLAQQVAANNEAAKQTAMSAGTDVPTESPVAQQIQRLQAVKAEMLTHYTASYPDVIAVDRQIAELRRSLPRQSASRPGSPEVAIRVPDTPAIQQLKAQIQSDNLQIAERRAQEAQIQSQIGSYQSKLMASPAIAAQYKELTRDNDTAQAFYNDLRNKIQTAQMATDLQNRQQGEQFRLLDAANLPEAPFSPKRPVFLAAGAAGGLALGLAIVLLLEFRDTSMRSERDVWAFLELPVLSTIPLSDQVPGTASTGRNWISRMFLRRVRRSSIAEPAKA